MLSLKAGFATFLRFLAVMHPVCCLACHPAQHMLKACKLCLLSASYALQIAEEGECIKHSSAVEKVRLQPKEGPIFSLAAEVPGLESTRRQIFCGNAAKSVSTWQLPAAEFDSKATLNGHTGWVRALATNGRWLFR